MTYRWNGPKIKCLALRAASKMALQVREKHRKNNKDPFGKADTQGKYPTLRLFFAVSAIESTWPADDCFNAILDYREKTGNWPWKV